VRERPVIGEEEGLITMSSLSSISCCSIVIIRSLSFFCLSISSLSLVTLGLGTECSCAM